MDATSETQSESHVRSPVLERQDLSCMCLAHHEPESINKINIAVIVINVIFCRS